MFVAPPEKEVEWTDTGLEGSFRWLARVWQIADQWRARRAAGRRRAADRSRERSAADERRCAQDARHHPPRDAGHRRPPADEHRGVGDDGAGQRALCLHREGERTAQAGVVAREAIESLIVMLSPFAPHTTEELWEQYGHTAASAARVAGVRRRRGQAEELVIPVQVNGKLRGRSTAARMPSTPSWKAGAGRPGVQRTSQGKTVKKVVIAKGRLVSRSWWITGHGGR